MDDPADRIARAVHNLALAAAGYDDYASEREAILADFLRSALPTPGAPQPQARDYAAADNLIKSGLLRPAEGCEAQVREEVARSYAGIGPTPGAEEAAAVARETGEWYVDTAPNGPPFGIYRRGSVGAWALSDARRSLDEIVSLLNLAAPRPAETPRFDFEEYAEWLKEPHGNVLWKRGAASAPPPPSARPAEKPGALVSALWSLVVAAESAMPHVGSHHAQLRLRGAVALASQVARGEARPAETEGAAPWNVYRGFRVFEHRGGGWRAEGARPEFAAGGPFGASTCAGVERLVDQWHRERADPSEASPPAPSPEAEIEAVEPDPERAPFEEPGDAEPPSPETGEAESATPEISDEELVRRAVRNARPRHPAGGVRWHAVVEALAVGSGYAVNLCRRFNLDPNEELPGRMLVEDVDEEVSTPEPPAGEPPRPKCGMRHPVLSSWVCLLPYGHLTVSRCEFSAPEIALRAGFGPPKPLCGAADPNGSAYPCSKFAGHEPADHSNGHGDWPVEPAGEPEPVARQRPTTPGGLPIADVDEAWAAYRASEMRLGRTKGSPSHAFFAGWYAALAPPLYTPPPPPPAGPPAEEATTVMGIAPRNVRNAFEFYKVGDSYANATKWATDPEHTEGALWNAFEHGYKWAAPPPAGDRELHQRRVREAWGWLLQGAARPFAELIAAYDSEPLGASPLDNWSVGSDGHFIDKLTDALTFGHWRRLEAALSRSPAPDDGHYGYCPSCGKELDGVEPTHGCPTCRQMVCGCCKVDDQGNPAPCSGECERCRRGGVVSCSPAPDTPLPLSPNPETLCPECGTGVAVDGDGCCASCGASATGSAVAGILGSLCELRLLREGRRSPVPEPTGKDLLQVGGAAELWDAAEAYVRAAGDEEELRDFQALRQERSPAPEGGVSEEVRDAIALLVKTYYRNDGELVACASVPHRADARRPESLALYGAWDTLAALDRASGEGGERG
jgi:hypothetical protein